MKLSESLVSIIVPAYNVASALPACVESLLSQSYTDLEIIIVDDSSKDDTYKIANILKKCDARIKVFRNKKRYGVAVSFNRALKWSRGQFIAFMNPTDIASMHKIKKQVKFLTMNPKVVAVGTQCTVINNKQKIKSIYPQEHTSIYATLLHGISMRFESTLINRLLLPKDLLKFTTDVYPFIYSSVFLKIAQYGTLANLPHYFYWHSQDSLSNFKQQARSNRLISCLQLLIQSLAEHDYRPHLKTFLQPFATPVKAIFR